MEVKQKKIKSDDVWFNLMAAYKQSLINKTN